MTPRNTQALAAALLSSLLGTTAHADSTKISADALFQEGRRLMSEGKYTEACPKFAESERLDPSASTLLNLGSCYEKWGHTASAWATYLEAASIANAGHRTDYVETATHHSDALFPHLARVTISVPNPTPGIEVRRDTERVDRPAWGVAIPVDPGKHTVTATAPGFRDWTADVTASKDGDSLAIVVPALEPVPTSSVAIAKEPAAAARLSPPPAAATPLAAPPAPRESTSSRSDGHTLRVAAVTVGALGVLSVGAGTAFTFLAKSKNSDSMVDCVSGSPNVCSATGVSLRNQALTFGNAATATMLVGGAAIATGVVLWVVAPRGPSDMPVATLGVVPTIGGAMLRGEW